MIRAARIFLGPVAADPHAVVDANLPVLVPDDALAAKLSLPKRPRTTRR
jgi:hypothetical protein